MKQQKVEETHTPTAAKQNRTGGGGGGGLDLEEAHSNNSTTNNNALKLNDHIFRDVVRDVTIVVDGESFLLHKFPLVSRCGRIRKMLANNNPSNNSSTANSSNLQLNNIPGGPKSFQLATNFCYGINFEITSSNVIHLLCTAVYLEMTDDFHHNNLISRAKAYLDEVVSHSIDKCIEVLTSCESLSGLPPAAAGIPEKCIDAIASNACKEQLVSSFSDLGSDLCPLQFSETGGDDNEEDTAWWVEDLSVLRIDYFSRVIKAMMKTGGVKTSNIVASLMHYAQVWLKGIGKLHIWNPARSTKPGSCPKEHDQKTIVETLVTLLPRAEENNSKTTSTIPLHFLFGMLRIAIVSNVSASCKLDLERRLGSLLEVASLDDLLIPSVHPGDSLFDVDTISRILVNFLQKVEEEEAEPEDCWYESGGGGGGGSGMIGSSPPRHGQAVLKVGRLIEAYLAEIARDPYLSLGKFISVIEILPDYSRIMDDGLYRAVDIYLKVHPELSEEECRKLCRFIDCHKLSQEASNHAAQNDRLPVQMTVRVLYFEQLRLKNSVSGSSSAGAGGDCSSSSFFFSQKMISSTGSGVPSAAMSPRDNYASMRRENRELKLEISRLRVRLSELEKGQACMKQEMIQKSGLNGSRTFLTSISKGIGRIGIFSGPARKKKNGRKGRGADGKCTGRSRRHSVS